MSVIKHMGNTVNGGAASVDILKSYEELDANTEPGKVVDALLVKDIKDNAGSGGSGGGLGYDIYSEEEIVVGVWTDGKPLYRTNFVFALTNTGVNNQQRYTSWHIDVNDVETVTDYSAISYNDSNNTFFPVGGGIQSLTSEINFTKTANGIDFSMGYSWDAFRAGNKVVGFVEYTKTTDPVNSFNPNQLLNPKFSYSYDDYSEGEKIIGRWTDGKPLYRLIVKVTLPTVNDRPIYELSDKSIDALIDRKLLTINKNHTNLGPSYTVVVPYAVAQQYYSQIWWQLDASQSCIKFYTSELSVYTGQPALLILEYTKTTDTADSFKPSMVSGQTDYDILTSKEEIEANTEPGKLVDALLVKKLSEKSKILYDGTMSANLNKNVISASDAHIVLSDSINNFSYLIINYVMHDNKENANDGFTTLSYNVICTNIQFGYASMILSGFASSSFNTYITLGFIDDTKLAKCWEGNVGWAHNADHITILGVY